MSECNLHDANAENWEYKTIPYDCGVLGKYELSMSVSQGGMWVEFGPERHEPILSKRFNIKYCPWCGKKLKENEE